MNVSIGIDVGAISIKAAVLLHADDPLVTHLTAVPTLQRLAAAATHARTVFITVPRRTRGRPLDAVGEVLQELLASVPAEAVTGLVLTGAGAELVGEALGATRVNEFRCCTRAVDLLYPDVRTVFEIGGETSRYLRLTPDPASGTLGILDYSTNGDCAAGTGAFLDQQAGRLKYAVEDIGDVVAGAARTAQIAGRCSVFAKSDMIHAQQKGYQPPEVLAGLCRAVALNFKSAVIKGRVVEAPAVLLGGVAANSAVVAALRDLLELSEAQLRVPAGAAALGAVGAACAAADVPQPGLDLTAKIGALGHAAVNAAQTVGRAQPLRTGDVLCLRDQVRTYELPRTGSPVDAYLGLDIGSVGTKLVLIDSAGEVIHAIFTRTEGRPVEVVGRALRELDELVGWGVRVRGVGSTGSGRELIGELVGADSINDEITAHKTGATFIGERLLGRRPDTIFEIGGQDSKYISLQQEATGNHDSIVVDFTMNEACAAGTGSFLEERAEELGVSIKDEFAALAMSSQAPLRLGERCTVFMERDVNTCMQRGAERADVVAGLAYSVAHNYINRVVRGRPIGDTIFFQGGTAYNDAVAAAFSIITGKQIIVPPHNAVLGAIGAALLAKEKTTATGAPTRFRGYALEEVNYTLREFTCHGCSNRCAIQEFNVEGEKTFWGDKCSERFRKQVKSEQKPVIPDLIEWRTRLMLADDEAGDPADATQTIGIPRAMYTWEYLPLWRTFFRACGFRVVLSPETNREIVRQGFDAIVAEPCFPIIVAHGHVAALIEQQVDYIWLPNLLTSEERDPDLNSYVCPWGSTLPFVVRQSPKFRDWQARILCPTLDFQAGWKRAEQALVRMARELGVPARRARPAFAAAQTAQQRFRTAYREAGRAALEQLREQDEPGMVLVGRPYNMHDGGVSLSVGRKLRELYGVNIIPVDALPLEGINFDDVNDNMYWTYGRRILAAAKLVAEHPNLHIIYVTNFKCGPDSFLKGFIRPASGKPFLTLQFDGHSNDAGMMTRCEAYLDSKGILRWWRTCKSKPVETCSPDEPSTSPKWRTPVPG